MAVANSLWGQDGAPLQSEFLDLIARHYGAAMSPVDFRHAADAARLMINQWVEDKTRRKIRDLISPGGLAADTLLLLVNAVYFKGLWVRQFRKATEKVLLEVPAGGVDEGETAEDAVRREMVEETGYRVGSVRKLSSFYTSPGFTTELMHLYEARDLQPGKATEETDQIEVELMTPEEALDRVESETVADAKTLLALKYAATRH